MPARRQAMTEPITEDGGQGYDSTRLLACMPNNWCDPMLTGPQRVIGDPPYECRDIERVLLGIRFRIENHLKANAELTHPESRP